MHCWLLGVMNSARRMFPSRPFGVKSSCLRPVKVTLHDLMITGTYWTSLRGLCFVESRHVCLFVTTSRLSTIQICSNKEAAPSVVCHVYKIISRQVLSYVTTLCWMSLAFVDADKNQSNTGGETDRVGKDRQCSKVQR